MEERLFDHVISKNVNFMLYKGFWVLPYIVVWSGTNILGLLVCPIIWVSV